MDSLSCRLIAMQSIEAVSVDIFAYEVNSVAMQELCQRPCTRCFTTRP